MSILDELGLRDDESLIELPDEVPEEGGGRVPLVQPGTYVFRLPEDMETLWGTFEAKSQGKRVYINFNRDNPLTIVSDPTYDGAYKNHPVLLILNNMGRPRGRDGVLVPDLFYLIRALEANLPDEERSALKTNLSYVETLNKYGGKLFQAELTWNAYCNKNQNIWVTVLDDEGRPRSEERPGTFGCGSSYTSYHRDPARQIPRDEAGYFKEFFDEIEVHRDETGCPARLRANAQLRRFKAVVG